MALEKILMPDLGEGVTEGELLQIKVKVGDVIALDDPLVEVMTDKASMDVSSILDGVVKEIPIKVGDMIPVGQPIIIVETKSKASTTEQKSSSKKETPKEKTSSTPQKLTNSIKEDVLAAPSTRKLASEIGIDLKNISPSGQNGQILREDLLTYIQNSSQASSSSPQSLSSPTGELCHVEEQDRVEPIRGIRRIMSETMTRSKQNIPHFTIMEEACMDNLIRLRSKLKPSLEKENIKLTYLPFIMKATLFTLESFPIFNSQLDDAKRKIIYRKSRNLGFAMDTKEGLLVPVIKNAQTQSILELTKSLQNLSAKAKEGRLDREELQGGTFTLTNLGSIGGLGGTPIIQPPQVAILGIYRFYTKLVKSGTEIEEKTFSQFSLTCDHRIIDGAKAAHFLKGLTLKLEEPERLLLN